VVAGGGASGEDGIGKGLRESKSAAPKGSAFDLVDTLGIDDEAVALGTGDAGTVRDGSANAARTVRLAWARGGAPVFCEVGSFVSAGGVCSSGMFGCSSPSSGEGAGGGIVAGRTFRAWVAGRADSSPGKVGVETGSCSRVRTANDATTRDKKAKTMGQTRLFDRRTRCGVWVTLNGPPLEIELVFETEVGVGTSRSRESIATRVLMEPSFDLDGSSRSTGCVVKSAR